MGKYVSPSKKGFYDDNIGGIPDDAIPISDELWQQLLAADIINWNTVPPSAESFPPPTIEQIYEQKLALIQANGETAAKAVKLPYSDEEANTWWCQYHEAEQYSANSAYVPSMLNAMVSSSGGAWVLQDLVSSILSNAAAWKLAAGDIIGNVKAKVVLLKSVKAGVDAGSKDESELINFDCSISVPLVNLQDKFD
ncbi:hypothetical protein [Dickeya zeae]|uniref:hypothetical protein n=1 Tax=Dickeya zeae TaxID=204042 RepID=UPI00039E0AEB|nr:hypothetical protein [Dickeya zeae]